MDQTFSVTPKPYGLAHWLILLGIAAAAAAFALAARKTDKARLLRFLFVSGLCMLAAEGFKQWFVMRYVCRGTPSLWFFPWQLCSMAMYCSALVPVVKGRAREAMLVFLCTFSPIGAVFALLFPEDMMRPQIVLFVHSFLYHALMLLQGIAALFLLKKRSRVSFLPTLVLFFCMAGVAEIVNVIGHFVIPVARNQPNMFYITPFYPSTQPVFDAIARHAGVFVEILVYLGAIVLAAFGLYLLEFRLRRKSRV